MARIKNYSRDISLSGNDLLLGSSYEGVGPTGPIYKTSSYRLDDVAAYANNVFSQEDVSYNLHNLTESIGTFDENSVLISPSTDFANLVINQVGSVDTAIADLIDQNISQITEQVANLVAQNITSVPSSVANNIITSVTEINQVFADTIFEIGTITEEFANALLGEATTTAYATEDQFNALSATVGINSSSISTNTAGITTINGDITAIQTDVANNGTLISTTASNLTALGVRVTTAESNVTTLQTDLVSLTTTVNTNTGDIATNATDISSLGTTISTANSNIALLQTDLTSLTATVNTNTGDISTNATDISTLVTNVNTANADITALQTDLTSLTTTVNGNTGDIATNATDVSALATRVTTAEADITAAETNITSLTTTVNGNTGDITANANSISALQTSVSTAQADITNIETDVTSLNTSVSDNGTNIATNASNITALGTRVTTAEADVTAIEGDLTSLTTTVNTNTGDISTNATNISTLSTTVSTQGTSISNLSTDLTTLTGTVNGNTGDIASNATSISALGTRVTTAEADITAAETSITNLTTTVDGNTDDISTNATNISTLSTSVTALDTTVTTLSSDVTTLTTDVNTATGDISANATNITNLGVTVGDNTADITTNATAIATTDGKLSASYGMHVNAGGKVAGLKLLADSTTTSSFIAQADEFGVEMPNGTRVLTVDSNGLVINGSGTFSGNLSAAGGTFSGNLSAAGGTFEGTLTAGLVDITSNNITLGNDGSWGTIANINFLDENEDVFCRFQGGSTTYGSQLRITGPESTLDSVRLETQTLFLMPEDSGNYAVGTGSLIAGLYTDRWKAISGNAQEDISFGVAADGTLTDTFIHMIRSASTAYRTINISSGQYVSITGGGNGGAGSISINPGTNNYVFISGNLSKPYGSFQIDHPLPEMKDSHHLIHSFVESPQANNIYRGKVTLENGTATINLDNESNMTEGTWVLLNRDPHVYTSNETDWDHVRGTINGNILTIECQNTNSTATVSWLVIGERHDEYMMKTVATDDNGRVIVELEKNEHNTPPAINN